MSIDETTPVADTELVERDVDVTAKADADAPAGGNHLTRLRTTSPVAAWILLLCGGLGMAAAATLTIERIQLLINPQADISCNINPIISCGSVMVTDQAKFFGFPNPLLGLAAFAVIITTAVLSIGRVRLPHWYWIGQTVVTGLGWIFVHYLIFQSVYRIGALCPYCMVVWTITPIIFAISLSQSLPDSRIGRSVREWIAVLLPVWYVAVLVIIGVKFWHYWETLF